MNLWAWLENSSLSVAISYSKWMYSACEVAHFFSFFIIVGATIMVDLRVLNLISQRRPVSELARQLFPWTYIPLCVVILSGFLMFTTDAIHYAPSNVFQIKMLLTSLAIVSSLFLQRKVSNLEVASVIPVGAKVTAILSVVLWIGAIIAAVEGPALTGVG